MVSRQRPAQEDNAPLQVDNAPLQVDNGPLQVDNAPWSGDNGPRQPRSSQDELLDLFSLRHPEMVGRIQAVSEKVSGPVAALAQVRAIKGEGDYEDERVKARAWCRVDLAGGTLDIWPLGVLRSGSRTVNVAVDLAARVELSLGGSVYRVRQGAAEHEAATVEALAADPETALVGVLAGVLSLPPFSVRLESEAPRGSGLGASSALAVAFLAAAEAELGRPPSAPARLAAVARDAEARLMQLPTGVQDHYPALFGGALEILQQPGGEVVRPLAVDLEALGDRLLVIYTGTSHFSAGQNWEVVRRRLDGEPEMVARFDGIAAAAAALPVVLEAGDWPAAGALVSREWSFRRELAAGISTPEIERLLATAAGLGAWGGKACGAGGGGCIAVLCPADKKTAVAEALEAAGGQVLAARPVASPLSIT